jgi:UTP--glucose-1-phosphate uridylyltransferase
LQSTIISVESVPEDRISSYGIIKGSLTEPDIYAVEDIIEKPQPGTAPSNLGAIGRYIFIPEIFDCLKRTSPGVGNEIQLTDAIQLHLQQHPVYAYQFHGKRYDTGDKLGYIETIVDFALKDPHLQKNLKKFLINRLKTE